MEINKLLIILLITNFAISSDAQQKKISITLHAGKNVVSSADKAMQFLNIGFSNSYIIDKKFSISKKLS